MVYILLKKLSTSTSALSIDFDDNLNDILCMNDLSNLDQTMNGGNMSTSSSDEATTGATSYSSCSSSSAPFSIDQPTLDVNQALLEMTNDDYQLSMPVPVPVPAQSDTSSFTNNNNNDADEILLDQAEFNLIDQIDDSTAVISCPQPLVSPTPLNPPALSTTTTTTTTPATSTNNTAATIIYLNADDLNFLMSSQTTNSGADPTTNFNNSLYYPSSNNDGNYSNQQTTDIVLLNASSITTPVNNNQTQLIELDLNEIQLDQVDLIAADVSVTSAPVNKPTIYLKNECQELCCLLKFNPSINNNQQLY